MRKIAILELLIVKRVQSFRAVKEQEVALMISSITSLESGPVHLSEMLLYLVNNAALLTLRGFALANFSPRLEWIHKFDGLEAKLNKAFMELDKFYDEVIEEHMKRKQPKAKYEDLVDVLLRVRSDSNQNISLTIDQFIGPLYTVTINFHHLLIILFVLTPTVLLLFQWRSGRRIFPPGPRGQPFIGNLHKLGELPHRSLQHLSSIYGTLMFLQLGSMPTLIISSADIARELFKNYDRVFSGRPHLYGLKKLSYGCLNIASAPYGEFWREVRKITVQELLSAKRVQSFRAVREEELALVMSFITSCSESGPIDLSEMLLRLVNNIVCHVTFSKKYGVEEGGEKSKIDAILRDTQTLLGGFALADFFPRLEWIHKFDGLKAKLNKTFMELDKFYDEVIEEHVKRKKVKPEHEDLVDVLLRVSSDPSQTITLTRDQIKGVLTDVFIAGTDTSSATVVWTMTELIKNPKEMDRAQEEVRRIFGTKDMIREEDLSQLSYLKLVIKESMRLHPPAPLLVPRETIENCTFFGYDIPTKLECSSMQQQSQETPRFGKIKESSNLTGF
ncbi:hypothetical protein GIB67_030984 [Kingdonia uniflora]|uniref:Cytochrome P450 n=1 Tax=Kingdonia uniflora TaxID=39325 RepID=A0A7J7L3K4_9MAGN|nr:hypothetical protein GIB67_030984 [Kingdonia uniflora]